MGVLVYFGYYQAHEDDPEKAVRDRAQAGHCSKQSKEPRSRRHALAGNGRLGGPIVWTKNLPSLDGATG